MRNEKEFEGKGAYRGKQKKGEREIKKLGDVEKYHLARHSQCKGSWILGKVIVSNIPQLDVCSPMMWNNHFTPIVLLNTLQFAANEDPGSMMFQINQRAYDLYLGWLEQSDWMQLLRLVWDHMSSINRNFVTTRHKTLSLHHRNLEDIVICDCIRGGEVLDKSHRIEEW